MPISCRVEGAQRDHMGDGLLMVSILVWLSISVVCQQKICRQVGVSGDIVDI